MDASRFFFKNNDQLLKEVKKFLTTLIESKEYLLNHDEQYCINHIGELSEISFDSHAGLCDNLGNNLGNRYANLIHLWLEAQFQQWDKFSGCKSYPVPSTEDYVDCCYTHAKDQSTTAERQYHSSELYKGKYGELRFELAEFLLKSLD